MRRVVGAIVLLLAAVGSAGAEPPRVTPRAASPCDQAHDLVAQALALEFRPPCDAECLRQKLYFYGRAERLCAGSPVVENNIGNLLELAGQLTAARAYYTKALSHDGTLAAAHFGLADVALAEGAYTDAVRGYAQGLAYAPGDAAARCSVQAARALAAGSAPGREVVTACLGDTTLAARGPDRVLVPAARLPLRAGFAEGAADLDPAAEASLADLAAALKDAGDTRFVVEGYADASEGADASALARRRAERVRDVLVTRYGLDPARLEARGVGDTHPVASGATAAARAANRRIELVRVGETPPAGPALGFDAAVLVEDAEGRLAPLAAGGTLSSGARYAVRFNATTRAYLYVVQEDAAGVLTRLFPNAAYGGGANPVRAGVDYFLPGGDRLFQLDDTVGTERVYLLATRLPARDVEDVIVRLDGAESPAARDVAVHEMVLQVRSRGVAGVVDAKTPRERGAFVAALSRADASSALTVLEFPHVARQR